MVWSIKVSSSSTTSPTAKTRQRTDGARETEPLLRTSWLKDALLQPESRECFERLLSQGWNDALRRIYGDERVYTFWDYFRQHWQTDSGLRIDHLLLSPDVAVRLKTAGVSKWVRGQPHASDHAPTWVELGPLKRTRRATKDSSA